MATLILLDTFTMSSAATIRLAILTAVLAAMAIAGCATGPSELLIEDPGGAVTTPLNNKDAFSTPAPNLSPRARTEFEIGNSFFAAPWLEAPAADDSRDGLGALFSASACTDCHAFDGRGAPPSEDTSSHGLLLKLGVDVAGVVRPHPVYGRQLQEFATGTVPREGSIAISYREIPGTYPDGTTYSLRTPTYTIAEFGYGPPGDLLLSPRIAPVVAGVGLLEAIPEEQILEHADPDDADGDGISGRANYVVSPSLGAAALGRFGWKANVATVEDQIAEAFLQDLGITSPNHLPENCTPSQTDCLRAPTGGSPELTADRLAKVVAYASTLAVPARREIGERSVIQGAALFDELGCAACHVATFTTGEHEIHELRGHLVTPFSDLLLHDMGPGLADGFSDAEASGSEWRTAPLWGLGLIGEVNGHTFLLHDGRARSIEEAILWHGGEAEESRRRYTELDADDRNRVIEFLESL